MGPKKGKTEEWRQCVKCQRVIHRTDVTTHTDDCTSTPACIIDNVLHARVTVTKTAQTKETLSKMSLKLTDMTLLLHPSVMVPCNLAIGQPCLVNNCHILNAWPCPSIPPTTIYLPSLLCDIIRKERSGPDDIVTVQSWTPSSEEATHVDIDLQTVDDSNKTDLFAQVFANNMEGRYISPDTEHKICTLGRPCTFHIRTIQTLHRPSFNPSFSSPISNSSPENLSHDLSRLNISSISDMGDNSDTSLPSTPLKHTGTTIHQSTQSPSVSTPVRRDQVLDQFQTPVANSQQPECVCRFVKVTSRTKFTFRVPGEVTETEDKKVMFDCLGGLDRQIEMIKNYCVMPLLAVKSGAVKATDMSRPQGILLFGPTGTGKSLLAQALANELAVYTAYVTPDDLHSKLFGETEKKLQNVFKIARQRNPSVIIMDHIDTVCPRREATSSDVDKRTVTTLLTLLDSLNTKGSRDACVVIGITTKPDDLDPALRRAGRLDLEIETGVPTAPQRLQILQKLLLYVPHELTEREMKHISDTTHGYVGVDLASLIQTGRLHGGREGREVGSPLTAQDVSQAMKIVGPSAMREVQFEVPQVLWTDIGGQAEVKLALRQAVELPFTHPEAFTRLGLTPPAGCLLYGPPGCSKTMIAKALATESGLNFLAVKGPELFGKYVGESERAVREIFRKARSAAPSIIFFDEIDSLAVERGQSGGGNNVADRVLTQLLTEMDGVIQLKGVTIVAATNRPDMIDKALLRPGRFDRLLYVPLPDPDTRREILRIKSRQTPLAPDVSLDDLVTKTDKFSGAELTALCQEAALCAMTESLQATQVHQHHFDTALKTVQPQTTDNMIQFYENYSAGTG